MALLVRWTMVLLLVALVNRSVGQVIQDFTLDNVDNERVSLADIKGDKLTIIDFWATWCKPCKKAMPKLNEFYEKYREKGLNVVGISCDGPRSVSQVEATVNNLRITYPILVDMDCKVMNAHQYQAFPTLIIIDQSNEVVYLHEGFTSGDEKKIEEAIVNLLK